MGSERRDLITENLVYSTHSKISSDQGDVKFDWKPADRDYFTARYSDGSQESCRWR